MRQVLNLIFPIHMKTYHIACIPGDGFGKEVLPAGEQVLQVLAKFQHEDHVSEQSYLV